MLISISAVEYTWYTYTATRKSGYFEHRKVGDELELSQDDVFGVRLLNDGSAFVMDMSDPERMKFKLSKKEIDALLKKAKPYRGKVKTPKTAIRNVEVAKDKNNLEAYTYQKYNAKKGTIIRNTGGSAIGAVRLGDVFGIFSADPTKGGWFVAKTVKDIDAATKPVKISVDLLSKLEVLSSPVRKKKVDIEEVIEEVKPKTRPSTARPPKPTQVESVKDLEAIESKIPNVADLKPLNQKVSAIIKELKALASSNIGSYEDFSAIYDQMVEIRDRDIMEDLKPYMHAIGVHKDMASLLLKTIKANWNASKDVIKAKKLALDSIKNAQIEDEDEDEEVKPVVRVKEGSGQIQIGQDSVQTFAKVAENAAKALDAKFKEITIATEVDELDSVIEKLTSIYEDYKARLQETGESEHKPNRIIKTELNAIKDKYLTHLEALNQKKLRLVKPVEEDSEPLDVEEDMTPEVTDEDYAGEETKTKVEESDKVDPIVLVDEASKEMRSVDRSVKEPETIEDITRAYREVEDIVEEYLSKLEDAFDNGLISKVAFKEAKDSLQKESDSYLSAYRDTIASLNVKTDDVEDSEIEDKQVDDSEDFTPEAPTLDLGDEDEDEDDKKASNTDWDNLFGEDDEDDKKDKKVDTAKIFEDDEDGLNFDDFTMDDFGGDIPLGIRVEDDE